MEHLSPTTYEDEIDLREIANTLWKGRSLILRLTAAAALIAFAISTWALPKKYLATTYLSVKTGIGTIFGIKTNSKNDDIRTLCGDVNQCPRDVEPEVKRLRDDANSSGTLATIGFIVGGVGLAAGGTLLLLSMDGSGDPSVDAAHAEEQPSLSAWLGPQSMGIRGTF
jgi:hypothetical protein